MTTEKERIKELHAHLNSSTLYPSLARGLWVIFLTLGIWIFAIYVWQCLPQLMILDILLTLTMGLLTFRMFLISHDLGHESLIPQKYDGWLLFLLREFSFWFVHTPSTWKDWHNQHHAVNWNVKQSDFPWIETAELTKAEYDLLTKSKQEAYCSRMYAPSFSLLAPLFVWWRFMVTDELSHKNNAKYASLGHWLYRSFMVLSKLIMMYYLGGSKIAKIEFFASSIAMCLSWNLFHLEHVFDLTESAMSKLHTFEPETRYAPMMGIKFSSYMTFLPRWLKFFTYGIEYHHIHHVRAKIPGYRLETAHDSFGEENWNAMELSTIDSWAEVAHILMKKKIFNEEEKKWENLPAPPMWTTMIAIGAVLIVWILIPWTLSFRSMAVMYAIAHAVIGIQNMHRK